MALDNTASLGLEGRLAHVSDAELADMQSHLADRVTVYRLLRDVGGHVGVTLDTLASYELLYAQVDAEIARRRFAERQSYEATVRRVSGGIVLTEVGR